MITVCGEARVDLVPTTTDALGPLQPALGGGPFNVARALGREGLLALREDEWADILSFAAHAGALTVSRTGAETPALEEVLAFQGGRALR